MSITLSWYEASGAAVYDLQYATNASFTSNVTTLYDLYGSQVRIASLRSGTPYYWRVLGRSNFATGTWSDTAAFMTKAPPDKGLVPLTPAVGTIDVPTQGVVSYSTSTLYTSYRVEFSTHPTFDPLVSTFTSASGTCQYNNLNRETTYFWRVRGLRDGLPPDVGTASHFTTLRNDVVSVQTTPESTSYRVWRDASVLRVRQLDTDASGFAVRVYDIQGRCLGRVDDAEGATMISLEHTVDAQLLFVVVVPEGGEQMMVSLIW
jgi:hypothetical protein